MNKNVTIEDQIRLLRGIKSVLEDIRHNLDTYIISEPQTILSFLRENAFPKEVADNYERKILMPDVATVTEIKQRHIMPTFAYIDTQIRELEKILNKSQGFR